MFKKENLPAVLLIAIGIACVSLIIFGSITRETVEEFDLATENDPFLGKEEAPVEIVNFSDFKCPWCKKWEQEVLPQIQSDYINEGEAKVVFKHLPFLAEDSMTGALAGEAIYQQKPDLFWKYIELMFKNQKNGHNEKWITHDFLMDLAKKRIARPRL
ncbi:thioredoxin domain-containing protein (plasmid) [Rossellomorea sp. AcN35-11]|nr:thioredoxin domain-containing protein [Rossellomorea sp. AcN35-11]